MMTEYPRRESHHAHKLVRLMIRACAAQDIGTDGFLLVTVIAHTEDAKRYTSPVTFWNEQLISILGFNSWGKLDRARKRAVAAGWLHYESGGKSRVGRYWTTIPGGLHDLPDGAVDCDYPHVFLLNNGEDNERETRETSGGEAGDKRETSGGHPGDIRGTSGEHSSLFPIPIPNPNPKRSKKTYVFSPEDMEFAQEMFKSLAEASPGFKLPNIESWAEDIRLMRERDHRPLDKIRKVWAWTHADERFWRKTILSPGKLRKHFDQLAMNMACPSQPPLPGMAKEPRSHVGYMPDTSKMNAEELADWDRDKILPHGWEHYTSERMTGRMMK